MAEDRMAELMALLQGRGGGLGVEGMYGPTMGAMQGGADIQRGRFGMPPTRAAVEPRPSLPEEVAEGEASDEDMLGQVQRGMGAGQPPPGSGMKWENLEDDQAALEEAPTPENRAAFIEYWGKENLPEGAGVQAEE